MPVTVNAVVAGIELSNNTLLQSGVVIIEILGNIFGVTNIFNIFFPRIPGTVVGGKSKSAPEIQKIRLLD